MINQSDTKAAVSRLNTLASLIRKGQTNPAIESEYQILDTWFQSLAPKSKPARSIMDLPIAKTMWELDAKDMNR